MRFFLACAALLTLSATASAKPHTSCSDSGHRDHDRGHWDDNSHHQRPHAEATLSVTNQFSGKVEVLVNGYRLGKLKAHETENYSVSPGVYTVQFCRSETSFCFQRDAVRAGSGSWTPLTVRSPMATLLVSNHGATALYVDAGTRESWVRPGETVRMSVPAGYVHTTASAQAGRSGLQVVNTERVWVEPGRNGQLSVSYAAPAHRAPLTLRNAEAYDVLVYCDGHYVGRIDAYQTARFDLPVGSVVLRATDRRGYEVTTRTVSVSRWGDSRFVVTHGHGHSQAASRPVHASIRR